MHSGMLRAPWFQIFYRVLSVTRSAIVTSLKPALKSQGNVSGTVSLWIPQTSSRQTQANSSKKFKVELGTLLLT